MYEFYIITSFIANESFYFSVYVNHRPVFGLDASEIENAFRVLAISSGRGRAADGDPAVDRGYLLELLQSRGDGEEYLYLLFNFYYRGTFY